MVLVLALVDLAEPYQKKRSIAYRFPWVLKVFGLEVWL